MLKSVGTDFLLTALTTTRHIAIQAGRGLQRDAVGTEDAWREELQNDQMHRSGTGELRSDWKSSLQGPRSDRPSYTMKYWSKFR